MSIHIAVTVERETKKAVMVSANGRTGWIQKRWMKDGLVSEKVFTKAADNMEAYRAARESEQAWKNSRHEIRVDSETEKAIATQVIFTSDDGEQDVNRLLWFPKSQAIGNAVPGWMIAAKVDEALRGFSSNACAFLDPEDAERLFK